MPHYPPFCPGAPLPSEEGLLGPPLSQHGAVLVAQLGGEVLETLHLHLHLPLVHVHDLLLYKDKKQDPY